MDILKMLRSLPKNSSIPCKYKFDLQEEIQEGLIEVGTTKLFLKHDNFDYSGDGEPIEPYSYSWFLCTSDYSYRASDIDCLEVLVPATNFNIGEL